MTIVQLINPGLFGGLETVVTHLATGLQQLGVESAALVVSDEGSSRPRILDDLTAAGVHTEQLFVPARRYAEEAARIRGGLARLNARVVHSHGYRMDVMARIVRIRTNVRWVSTLHGFTGGGRKNRLFEWLQLRSLRSADRVIGVSSTVINRARASGVSTQRLRLIQNAVPPRQSMSREEAQGELGLDAARRWVGWVGRTTHEKDPESFARAISELGNPAVGGVIVGSGPLLAAVERNHQALIASGRLMLAGQRPDAGRLMPAFDALALSSVTEGTPMVVLEAMQAGVPVVAYAVGGLPDVIGGGAGVLVPERSATLLARAIRDVLQDPRAADAVVRVARARVESEFSTARWLSTHVQLYSELSAVPVEIGS